MTTWNPQANDVFLNALELRFPDERREYLDRTCADNAALRAEVEAMLAASEQAGSFLEAGRAREAGTLAQTVTERPSSVIGPYKLLQQIGEGGMGTVYMAEQSHPVQRKVALKVIKAGMDSGQVVARFEAERQALALMDHPNIAKVIDAGTTSGAALLCDGAGQRLADHSVLRRKPPSTQSAAGAVYVRSARPCSMPITRV